MKAVLKFDCSDPEEEKALKRCMKSFDMASVLFEITYNLQKKFEYDEEMDDNTIVKIFDEIYNILDGHNILIDDLID